MARAGGFRHTLDIDALTPFPVPWSYPKAGDELKAPKYSKFESKPFPKSQFRYKPLRWDPFPHQESPDAPKVPVKHQLDVPGGYARILKDRRAGVLIDGKLVIARLILRPGERIKDSNAVYVAKIRTPKQTGTGYSIYILRVRPEPPKKPGKGASQAEQDSFAKEALEWTYKFNRPQYWNNVSIIKHNRLVAQEQNRDAWEKYVEQEKERYYKNQAKARIEYERYVSELQATFKRALLEYQVSKIGSYYGNKYSSLYGSYFD